MAEDLMKVNLEKFLKCKNHLTVKNEEGEDINLSLIMFMLIKDVGLLDGFLKGAEERIGRLEDKIFPVEREEKRKRED